MREISHVVYILLCQNNSLYTGYTTDLKRRYQEHVKGSAKCKYTKANPPKEVVASWVFHDKSRALKLEYRIKQLSRKQKLMLIDSPEELENLWV